MRKTLFRTMVFALLAGVLTLTNCGSPTLNTADVTPHTHDWGNWAVTTPATCTEEGIETRICSHDANHIETRIIDIDPDAHDWDDWDESIPATCETSGEGTRVCKLCDEAEFDVIPALGHVWEIIEGIPATCTTEGAGKSECTVCGEIKTDNIIPALGHDWGAWLETAAPSCTTAGTDTRICAHDVSHFETRTGAAALGHDYKWSIITAATCTTTGTETGTCSHDAAHSTSRPVDALGHNYGNWTQTTAPTCTTAGVERRVCAHDAAHFETRTGAPIDPNAHNWGNWSQTSAPTCTATGTDTRVCSHNTWHIETRTGAAALGHDYAWAVTIPATCETAGIEIGTCTHDAAHIDTRVINALGHDYRWVITTSPTLIETGVETAICSHDSSHTNGTRPAAQLPITNTAEWGTACSQLNGRTGNYTLTISGDIGVAGTTVNTFGTTAIGSELSVTLNGSGKLFLTSQGNLLRIYGNQTLIIDSEDLTLQGLSIGQNGATQNNNASLVYLQGTPAQQSTVELQNGTITGNTNINAGGGVSVYSAGNFTMNNGTISNNTADRGGGISSTGVNITINGGTISGNTAIENGGGVYFYSNTNFTMNNGTISNNTANNGGGVYGETNVQQLSLPTYPKINGGTISGNTATNNGGGLYINTKLNLYFTTGTIYGSNESNISLRNTANAGGAALFINGSATAQRGYFNGSTWVSLGNLSTTNNTLRVLNGVFQ